MACGGIKVVSIDDAAADDASDAEPIDAGPDIDNGKPSDTYPAFKPEVPQVVTTGGPILTHTRIVPAFFPNDDFQTQTTDFLAKYAPSPNWPLVMSEFGVIDATVTAPVAIGEVAPGAIDDADIKTWLAGKLDGTHLEWPVPDDGTVYVLFYPASTKITLMNSASCQQFGGYHNDVALKNGKKVAYAVIPRCLGTFNTRTVVLTHELVEAASDPYPNLMPAYQALDEKHFAWMLTSSGGEIGDMCENDPLANYQVPDLGLAIIQRSWSNKSAKAYHDPCLPLLPNRVYFNSTPVLPDMVKVSIPMLPGLGPLGGKTFTVEGVKIPVGQSRTIDVQLWSDAATGGPWKVSTVDVLLERGYSGKTMDFAWDRTSGVNGEILHLTITSLSASLLGVSAFQIVSTKGLQKMSWTGVVDMK